MKIISKIDFLSFFSIKRSKKSIRNKLENIDFQEIFFNLPEALAVSDEFGTLLYVNKEFENLFKYSKEKAINKNIDDLITAEQNKAEALAISQRVFKGEAVNIEGVRYSKDKKPIPVNIRGKQIIFKNNTKAVFAVYRNISELKNTKKNLNISETMFRLIFENSPLATFLYSEVGLITACNKDDISLLGISKEEMIGFDLLNNHQDENLKELINKSLKSEIGHFEGRIKFNNRKQNSYIKIHTAPIISHAGELLGGIGMVEDVTKRIEEENDLKHAKEKAEEADSLKTAFLANMSHEIRTPMNAIIGFSDLLTDPDITDEEKEEYVNVIKNNGNILLNIIDDIIDIAKIEAGQIKIYRTQCAINEILYELYTNFNKQKKIINKTNVEIIINTGKFQNITILSDPFRLRQILTNLLNNALKFTEKGYIQFGFTIEDPLIKFFVKDTGIGIDEDKVNDIFSRFRQADLSDTRKYGGTGLGLTISKNLVELLGGKMWVESKVNEGSSFYFELPYQKISSSGILPNFTQHESIEDNWENKSILIVEDDITNYKYLEKALRKTKARIIWVEDGQPAVDICNSKEKIDLVLMDIQMPLMDGYEATRQIKRIRKNIPIVAQTAYAMSGERDKSIKAGCDDYIPKPIKISTLHSVIRKYLK